MNISPTTFSASWLTLLLALLVVPQPGLSQQPEHLSSLDLASMEQPTDKEMVQENDESMVHLHIQQGPTMRISLDDLNFSRMLEGVRRLEGLKLQDEDALEDFDTHLRLVLRGDHRIEGRDTIEGSVLLLGGDLEVAGVVEGDLLALDGQVRLEEGAYITGHVVSTGASITQDPGATIGESLAQLPTQSGEGVSPPSGKKLEDQIKESVSHATDSTDGWGFWGRLSHGVAGILQVLFSGLLVLGLGGLMAYFTPQRLGQSSQALRHHFGRSFAVGLLGEILILPLLVVLAVMIITIPVIPLVLLALFLLMLAAKPVVAHMVGRWFLHRPGRPRWVDTTFKRSPYHYLAAGVGLFLVLPILAKLLWMMGGFLAGMATLIVVLFMSVLWVFHTAGFGALLLSRLGSDKRWTSPSHSASNNQEHSSGSTSPSP